jgi:hypothetical protein
MSLVILKQVQDDEGAFKMTEGRLG